MNVAELDPYLVLAAALGVIATMSLAATIRAGRRLRQQLRRQAVLADGAVLLLDGDSVLDCSEAASVLLGEVRMRSASDVIGAFAGAEAEALRNALHRAVRDGAEVVHEFDGVDGARYTLRAAPEGAAVKVVLRRFWLRAGEERGDVGGTLPASVAGDVLRGSVFDTVLAAGGLMLWHRDADGKTLWSGGFVPTPSGRLLPTDVTELLARDLAQGSETEAEERTRSRVELTSGRGAEKIALEISECPASGGGRIGFAVDASVAAAAERSLTRFVQTMTETFAHVDLGIAIFDRNRSLVLYNPALAEMWQADPAWLAGQPSLRQVLERLRSARRIPDLADFHSWRERLLALFDDPDPDVYEELWHLSDGANLRVRARPHPHGGVAFIFEDVSERMQLEQRYRHSIDLRKVTLNRLDEGLAVFGPDGILQFVNSAFHEIWGTDPETLGPSVHARDVIGLCQGLTVESDVWERLLALVASDQSSRAWSARLTMGSGRILSARFATLPDGATMAVFADITDSERIALALRDRNEALEAVEEMRSAVFDQISHRLRTPLNTIFGFGQLLTDPRFGSLDERQMEYASGILEASGHLLDTIDDVTELASLQLDPSLQEGASSDLAEMMQVTRRLLDKRAYEQGVELSIDLPERALRLNRDVVQMRQIVFNMLSDAIQRAQTGGRITLTASAEEGGGLQIRTIESPPATVEPKPGSAALDQIVAESLSLSFIRRMVAREGGSLDIQPGRKPGQIVTICRFDGVLEEPRPGADEQPAADDALLDRQEEASGSTG